VEPFLVEDLGLVGHEPADTVSLAWAASAFDDEAAAVGCALWRVRDFGWQKEELTLPDHNVSVLVVFEDFDTQVTLNQAELYFKLLKNSVSFSK
jgi:hypothetical protein